MTIGDIQTSQVRELSVRNGSPEPAGPEQAARNREVIKAIKQINEGGGIGPSSELRFALDRESGQAVIKIVDRVTNETIAQVPTEEAVRTAEVLRSLQLGERIG